MADSPVIYLVKLSPIAYSEHDKFCPKCGRVDYRCGTIDGGSCSFDRYWRGEVQREAHAASAAAPQELTGEFTWGS